MDTYLLTGSDKAAAQIPYPALEYVSRASSSFTFFMGLVRWTVHPASRLF